MNDKTTCKKCGVEIMPATAERTNGLCMPCKKSPFTKRVECTKCGAKILKDTAKRNNGLCAPCKKDPDAERIDSKVETKPDHIAEKVEKILEFFMQPDAMDKQNETVTRIKKNAAMGRIGSGIGALIFGGLALVYGGADVFGGLTLPMGVLFLIAAPFLLIGGLVLVMTGSAAMSAGEPTVCFGSGTDLDQICRSFYKNVFCRRGTDFDLGSEQFVRFCKYFPAPALTKYERMGWDGLSDRWLRMRQKKSNEDVEFSLISMTVHQAPREDARAVDITVQLDGRPYGRIKFANVAFHIDDKWFLATPEPVVI